MRKKHFFLNIHLHQPFIKQTLMLFLSIFLSFFHPLSLLLEITAAPCRQKKEQTN